MTKKKFHKINRSLIFLGTNLVFALPIISVISCGNKGISFESQKSFSNYRIGNVRALDFKKVFKDLETNSQEPIFLGGINYTAYTQGMSFIFNILKGLGWNWEDKEKINRLYDRNYNFNNVKPSQQSNLSNFMSNHTSNDFEKFLGESFNINYKKGLYQFLEKRAQSKVVSTLYNQIKALVHIGSSSKNFDAKKLDMSTEVKVDLGIEFQKLQTNGAKLQLIANKLNDMAVLNQIFQNKKYAYTWGGNILHKLGFQIQKQGKSSFLFLWHISDGLPEIYKKLDHIREQNDKAQTLFARTNLKKEDQKNLSQVVLDPIGASGTMPRHFFFTNANLRHTSDTKSPQTYFPKSINVFNHNRDGWCDWDNTKWVEDKKPIQNISSYSSFIDAENPGTVVLQMYEGKAMKWIDETLEVAYPLKTITTRNRIQTFYELKNAQKIEQMVNLVFKFIKFFQQEAIKNTSEIIGIEKIAPPTIKSLFEFLRNNKFSKNDIDQLFRKYNNGSHYMLAIEIFLRGMKNVPVHLLTNFQAPIGMKFLWSLNSTKFPRKKNEIVGMVNVNSIFPMLFLAYSSSKPNTKNTYYNFNPQTRNYLDEKNDFIDWFIKDLSSQTKTGKETKVYDFYQNKS